MSEPARLRPPRSQTSAPKLTKRPRPSSSSSGAERSTTQDDCHQRGGARGHEGSSSNRDKNHQSYPNGGDKNQKRDHHQSYAPHLSVKKARVETYDAQSHSNSYSKGSSTGVSKSSSSVRLKTNSSYGGRGQDGSSEGRGAHSRYGGSSEKGKGSSGAHAHHGAYTEKGKKGHGYKGSSHGGQGKEKGSSHGRHNTWWKDNAYGAHSRWPGGSTHGSHMRDKGKESYGKARRRDERTYREGDTYWSKKDGEKDESKRDEGKVGVDLGGGWYPPTEEDGTDTHGKSTSYCAHDEHDGIRSTGGDRSTSRADGEKKDECSTLPMNKSPSTTAGGAHHTESRDEAHDEEDKNGILQAVGIEKRSPGLTEEHDDYEQVLSNTLFTDALLGGDEEEITKNGSKKHASRKHGGMEEKKEQLPCIPRERRESKREKEAREMHHRERDMMMPSSTSRHDSRSLPFFPRSPSKERGGTETELKACVTAVHELANSWKFGVEFLMSWNKTKKYSETELYDALQDFVEESKKKPEYSHLARFHPTVISVRSLIQTLELVDMHVRKLAGPEEELRVVTKSKLCTCIIRVIGHAAMFADLDIDLRGPHENSSLRRNMIGESIQVQRHRRAAEALVEKCNLAMKNEREWIPKAAVRMCNAYARDAYSVGQRSMEIKKRNKSSVLGGLSLSGTSNHLPSTSPSLSTTMPLVKDGVEAERLEEEEKKGDIIEGSHPRGVCMTNKTGGDKDKDDDVGMKSDGDKDKDDVVDMNTECQSTLVIGMQCVEQDDGNKTERVSMSAVEGEVEVEGGTDGGGGNARSDINAPDQGNKGQHTHDDEKMDDVHACEENGAPVHTTASTHMNEKDKEVTHPGGYSISPVVMSPAAGSPAVESTPDIAGILAVSPVESEEGLGCGVRDAYSLPLECASEDEREGLLVDEDVENEGEGAEGDGEEVGAVEEGEVVVQGAEVVDSV